MIKKKNNLSREKVGSNAHDAQVTGFLICV